MLADGTVLVADTEEDLKHNIAALQEAVREHKLAINWGRQTLWWSAVSL